jgi:hypothetical protein
MPVGTQLRHIGMYDQSADGLQHIFLGRKGILSPLSSAKKSEYLPFYYIGIGIVKSFT